VRNGVKTARDKGNEFVREVMRDKNLIQATAGDIGSRRLALSRALRRAFWRSSRDMRRAISLKITGTRPIKAKANAIARFPVIEVA